MIRIEKYFKIPMVGSQLTAAKNIFVKFLINKNIRCRLSSAIYAALAKTRDSGGNYENIFILHTIVSDTNFM